jgi:hypothetical protein
MTARFIASIALLAWAGAAAASTYGPVAPVPLKPQVKTAIAKDKCADQRPRNDREIVVCAPRPEGFRLNPDVVEARREARSGGPVNPPPNYKENSCAVVGPWSCTGGGINLIAAGIALATMARRAATGGNVGQMFVTNPQPTEYELYQAAKKRREAREATTAAAIIRAQAQAAAASAGH